VESITSYKGEKMEGGKGITKAIGTKKEKLFGRKELKR